MLNAFTVDLEDWYCSRALETQVRFEEWRQSPSRVGIGTRWLLDLLERHSIEATFFVLGYVAEREPELIREIAERGHEIASHGYAHQPIYRLNEREFALDLERADRAIETASGRKAEGYRAPDFSMIAAVLPWAYRVLRECGFSYSSSIFPLRLQPGRGVGDAPLTPHRYDGGVLEVPISCALVGGVRLPAAGGGYLRQFPFALTRALWRRCNVQGRPVIFHLHPWELDPDAPRLPLQLHRRLRQWRNIDLMRERVEQLVEEFRFTSLRCLPEVQLHLASVPVA